jgi:hypothetical protein
MDSSGSSASGHEVRCDDADEFAGSDYFGLLPELWKMSLVSGYQVVGPRGVGAFKKFVVVRIFRDLERTRSGNDLRMVLYELEELLPKAPADFEFQARENLTVFRENGFGDIQSGRFDNRKQEHGALKSVRFQGRGDEDIGIDDEAERDHLSSTVRCLRARGLDNLVDPARTEPVRALAPGFLSDQPEHFRLGGGKSNIVADAEQHCFGRATLLDDKRPALVLHATQQLAKIGAGVQGGDDYALIIAGSGHGELSSSITRTVQLIR